MSSRQTDRTDGTDPAALLRNLHRLYVRQQVPAQWAAPTEEAPFESLIVRFDDIGDRAASIHLELSFIPGLDAFRQEGVYLLQSFAAIGQTAGAEAAAELLQATAAVNTQLPLGAFGLFADSGSLYFKHNTMLHRDWITAPDAVSNIDRQNGLLLHQFHQFAERLIDVAEGRLTAKEALRGAPLVD